MVLVHESTKTSRPRSPSLRCPGSPVHQVEAGSVTPRRPHSLDQWTSSEPPGSARRLTVAGIDPGSWVLMPSARRCRRGIRCLRRLSRGLRVRVRYLRRAGQGCRRWVSLRMPGELRCRQPAVAVNPRRERAPPLSSGAHLTGEGVAQPSPFSPPSSRFRSVRPTQVSPWTPGSERVASQAPPGPGGVCSLPVHRRRRSHRAAAAVRYDERHRDAAVRAWPVVDDGPACYRRRGSLRYRRVSADSRCVLARSQVEVPRRWV